MRAGTVALGGAVGGLLVVAQHDVAQVRAEVRGDFDLVGLEVHVVQVLQYEHVPVLVLRIDTGERQAHLLQPGPVVTGGRFPQGQHHEDQLVAVDLQLPDLLLQDTQEVLAVCIDHHEGHARLVAQVQAQSRLGGGLRRPFELRVHGARQVAGRVNLLDHLAVGRRHVDGPLRGGSERAVEEHQRLAGLLIGIEAAEIEFV